jgi:hypothetical protein
MRGVQIGHSLKVQFTSTASLNDWIWIPPIQTNLKGPKSQLIEPF